MSSEIREALNAAGAASLVQKHIDPRILEYQRRYNVLLSAIPAVKWDSTTYWFNTRNVVGGGGNVTDGGTRPVTQSTYTQNKFDMAHFVQLGGVTGFAQETTRSLVQDLRALELQGAMRGQYMDIEHQLIWGNAAATINGAYPQFDGLDTQVGNYTGAAQNAIDYKGAQLSLSTLDELADLVENQAAMDVFNSEWMFVMSPTMLSKIAQLQVSQQRFVDKVNVATGLLVDTYRGIPLVKSSYLASRSFQQGTVTGAATSTGSPVVGVLPTSSTYIYSVSSVIARQGEIAASADVTVTTAAVNSIVTLSLSASTGLDGLGPNLYKVYRTAAGGGTATKTLLGVVDATVGLDANGNAVATTSIIDTGAALVPANGSTLPGTIPAAYVGGNLNRFPPLLSAGNSSNGNTEGIYLMSRNPDFIVRPWVREIMPVDVFPTTASPDTLPFALISDTTLAIRAGKYLARADRVGTLI